MKADFEKGTKVCSRCRKELPLNMFGKNGCQGLVGGTKWTGYLQEECIDCPYYMNNAIGRKDKKK